MKPLEIGIVGAGPAGLAAALFLARDGHKVTVLERFDQPKPIGSGLILQPTGLSVLGALGLLPAILARGTRINRLHGADARSGRTVLDVAYDRGRFGVAVHRAALFNVLHEAVAKEAVEIVTNATIADAEPSASHIRLKSDDGRQVGRFDLAIDASGARSVLKRRSFYPAEPKPLAYGAFWASLEWRGKGFDKNALMQRYDRACVMIGILPIGRIDPTGDDMAAFFWSLKPDEADRVRDSGINAWKERVAGYWPECQPYLDQITSFDDLTLARYGHHTLRVPAGRRLAIIGDAAHSTSPQLGQGANMALLDAAALTNAMRVSSDLPMALDRYAGSRRLHVRLFQSLSMLLTPFYQSDSTIVPFLRDRLVSSVAKVPPMPKLLAGMVSGTLANPFSAAGLNEIDWREISPPRY